MILFTTDYGLSAAIVFQQEFTRIKVLVPLLALAFGPHQARFLEKGNAQNVLVFHLLERSAAGLELVADRVTLLGDRDLVARVKIFFLNPDAVHLDAVGATLVADVPVTAAEAQLGVQPGDVRKGQFDVAGLPASERQFIAEETNRITAADRH